MLKRLLGFKRAELEVDGLGLGLGRGRLKLEVQIHDRLRLGRNVLRLGHLRRVLLAQALDLAEERDRKSERLNVSEIEQSRSEEQTRPCRTVTSSRNCEIVESWSMTLTSRS